MFDTRNRLSATAKQTLVSIISTHEKWSRSYFWSGFGNSNSRAQTVRRFKRDAPDASFQTAAGFVRVRPSIAPSRENAYYSLNVETSKDGTAWQKGTVRDLKRILDRKPAKKSARPLAE